MKLSLRQLPMEEGESNIKFNVIITPISP